MEDTKKTTKVEERYVITKDGLRMTYKEYLEMRESEKN